MKTSFINRYRVQIFLTFLILGSWHGLPSIIKIAALLYIGSFALINYIEGFELDTSIELMLMTAVALVLVKPHPSYIYIIALTFIWGSRLVDKVIEDARIKESGLAFR